MKKSTQPAGNKQTGYTLNRFVIVLAVIIMTGVYTIAVKAQAPAAVKNSNDTLSIEEKLVQLALSGPLLKASESQNKINEFQLKAAKNQWVNLITLSTNFNDQNFFTQNRTNGVIFPRYFSDSTCPLEHSLPELL